MTNLSFERVRICKNGGLASKPGNNDPSVTPTLRLGGLPIIPAANATLLGVLKSASPRRPSPDAAAPKLSIHGQGKRS